MPDELEQLRGRLAEAEEIIAALRAGHVDAVVGDQAVLLLRLRETELALRKSRQRLERVLDGSNDGFWEWNIATGELYVSTSWCEILGIDPQDAPTSYNEARNLFYPEDVAMIERELDAVLMKPTESERFEIEHRFQRPDGAPIWVHGRGQIVQRDEDGRAVLACGAITDVTQRKEAERALRAAHDELEDRVRQRTGELRQRADQLVRLTSELTIAEERERRRLARCLHDHLQQLLVAARLNLDLLARGMNAPQRERVRESINMIDEAVTASRSLTIELSPPILHDAGLPAAFEWLARWVKERHGLQVGVSCDPQADSEREDIRVLIFQATRELLFNVVKHAKVDRACVELSLHENDALKIVVRDRGVGFEPDPTNAAVDSSNGGFGLFSIAERVQSLGGRLDVESAPQQGTRVTLIVPIESLPSDADKGHATPDPESEVPSAPAIRVLLADDHKVMRQGLYSMLQNCDDMEVVGQASDGREAIELARRLQPDVILMDYRMAPIDGIEATRILHAEMPGARIIGLSMYESADRAAAMLSAGACAYVTKSGKAAELLETIRCVKPDRVPQP